MAKKMAKTRRCIICKDEQQKSELNRFVKNLDDEIIFDAFHKAPGKGAYVCNSKECLLKALDKKIIGKFLKAKQHEELKPLILNALIKKFSGSASVLKKAGLLVYGTDKVKDYIKSNKINFVIYAKDSSDTTIRKVTQICETKDVEVTDFLDKTSFESITGTANTTVIAFKESKLTDSLKKVINTYKILSNT